MNAEQRQSAFEGTGAGERCTEPADACTVRLSAGGARYWGANTADTEIFYTEGEDLYEASIPLGQVTPRVTALTRGAGVQGVVQISEDGSYVYFVAKDALTGAEGEPLENIRGDEPQEGQDNLYLSHGGAVQYIATLSTGDDFEDWRAGPGADNAVLAPGASGGGRLAFVSVESLTGYDNDQAESGECESRGRKGAAEDGKCREVYLFDTESGAGPGSLACASCDPSGARPLGPAGLAIGTYDDGGGAGNYRPRDLLEDGSLFFDSSDALVSRSSRGVQSVYEYEDGHVYAISDPAGRYGSFFLDASADGRDVFFATADQLLPQDESSNVVIYDAREDGGFPLSAVTPACASAESCKPPVSPQPGVYGPAASATVSGGGNLTSPQPPKPKSSTSGQKLSKALAACRKAHRHSKKKRLACERGARKAYGAKASARKADSAKRATNDRRASR